MHNASGHPLSFYHFGGDEVPADAWKGSPKCQQLMEEMGFDNNADIKRYFFETVVNASIGMHTLDFKSLPRNTAQHYTATNAKSERNILCNTPVQSDKLMMLNYLLPPANEVVGR